jgi:hypothetical protein
VRPRPSGARDVVSGLALRVVPGRRSRSLRTIPARNRERRDGRAGERTGDARRGMRSCSGPFADSGNFIRSSTIISGHEASDEAHPERPEQEVPASRRGVSTGETGGRERPRATGMRETRISLLDGVRGDRDLSFLRSADEFKMSMHHGRFHPDAQDDDPQDALLEQMIRRIGCMTKTNGGARRKAQPRAIKKRKKYPYLTSPRGSYREIPHRNHAYRRNARPGEGAVAG